MADAGVAMMPLAQRGQLLSLLGRIVTMDMATVQYIDKRACFQYVEFFLYT